MGLSILFLDASGTFDGSTMKLYINLSILFLDAS